MPFFNATLIRIGYFVRLKGDCNMMDHMPKTEAELRQAVIDRLIAASVDNGRSAREAALLRWRDLPTKQANAEQTIA